MGNYIFIPDNVNLFSVNGENKGEIHYRFNTQIPSSVIWTTKQKLIYKLQNTNDMLSEEEKFEFTKLFENAHQTPSENILKKCLLVIISKSKPLRISIGLKVIDRNNYTTFKSLNVNETIELCKKNNITIDYDNKYAFYLLNNAYLNEIISEDIWEYTAIKYIKLKKRDKVFSAKFKQLFFS